MNRTEFDRALEQLRNHAGRLFCATEDAFPPGEDVAQGPWPGYSGDYPLQFITAPLDDVLASFDILQKAMGWPYEGRHERFLRGQCSCNKCS